MTIQNDFLPFAASENANVLEQADYEKLVARRTGFTSGVAMAAQLNKVWRQSSLMAAALARFIVERSGQPLIDDGTTQAIVNHLHAAIAEVDLAWSKITGKPTTLTGYGITDAVNVEEKGQPEGVATLNAQGHVPTEQLPRSKVDLAWSKITGKPTTLTGYGITDAVNVEEKGQPEGVATLDDQGYVPTEQLPALDFTPADGSITTPKLADDAVTSSKIAYSAVTSSKIAGGAVTSSEIASGAVTSSEIAYGAVTSSKIAYGAVVDNIGYKPLSPENDQAIDGTLNVRYWLHIRNLNDSALRSAHHNDGTIGFVGPRGWMVRFGDDGNFWTPIFGWLSNTLNGKANAGAECQYNSQIWSFSTIHRSYNQTEQDLPDPWVCTGLNMCWGMGSDYLDGIGVRARKIRNQ
ncbi:hypothetical protein CAGGBEG34_590003 [Candidatus Glomeribacter gigasporarum BEG34]|uniref:Uncharacterized protein n=1 Tax=Candidatus Glomeribacter gigasporarum BEG34 TaxID=1070319 RepID=G2JBR7_9BURK|nr:hypothetical protein [Candidatus Glomeribacter gigasporarum]CCD30222.1 hypothetical protein CAGGBEG34_590003 [Candidatus Glomeribacter gigasporarum BEG34]